MARQISAVEVHSLHQQARNVMAGIQLLAHDVETSAELSNDESVIKGIDELQLDLSRLKLALDKLQALDAERRIEERPGSYAPSLLGGMALGVVLGKLWGSKLQLDLLPFLVGMEIVTGRSPVPETAYDKQ